MQNIEHEVIRELEVTHRKHSLLPICCLAIFFVLISLSGVYAFFYFQPQTISLSETAIERRAPQKRMPVGVAGASNINKAEASFETLVTAPELQMLGTTGICQTGTLFTIGEKENTLQSNPADEFNWVGALDVVPEYANPFIVNATPTTHFPWRSDSKQPDTLNTAITFAYAGSPATAELLLSWSPGKQGNKQKEVLLDSMFVGYTQEHNGYFSETSWENMPIVLDSLPVTLTPGTHTITLRHHGQGEAIWDYLELHITACSEPPSGASSLR